jgi:hypothetical protein
VAWIEQTGKSSWRVRYPGPLAATGRAKVTVAAWAVRRAETLDVETRTEENYRAYLRNHILPHWRHAPLGQITALAVTAWIKALRKRYAAPTVAGIVTVVSMMLDDAVDEHLIPVSPVHWHRRVVGAAITPHPATNGYGRCPTRAMHRRPSPPPRWPVRRAVCDHRSMDRMPLG